MFFNKKTKKINELNDNPYWMSFSDMMSGMLIIFILLCITLLFRLSQIKNEVTTNIEELKEANKVRSEILHEIADELANPKSGNPIIVEITDNDTVLRIPANVLNFDHNSIEINNIENAERIGYALYKAINTRERSKKLETIFIEGHADSTRGINDPGDRTNWYYSTQRAVSLWQYWIVNMKEAYGAELEGMTNYEGKHLFSVSGYGATRRVVQMEDSPEAFRRNRRIDIRITTKQPTIVDLENTIQPINK